MHECVKSKLGVVVCWSFWQWWSLVLVCGCTMETGGIGYVKTPVQPFLVWSVFRNKDECWAEDQMG